MSLDGYIAGPNGEYDWIPMDPEVDFAAMWMQFDTFLIGRKTWETMVRMGNARPTRSTKYIVCSRTLTATPYEDVPVEADATRAVARLREQPGRDIAIFGGGELFRSLLAADLVDRVEVSVVPILLGGGVSLLPPPSNRARLKLRKLQPYEKTGTVLMEYDVIR
jgi:dihydrofolate reductase